VRGRRCLGCGARLRPKDERVQYGRLLSHGADEGLARSVLPRCARCVTAACEDRLVLLPHYEIARSGRPAAVATVLLSAWQEMYGALRRSGHPFVAVRYGKNAAGEPLLLLVTTAPLPGVTRVSALVAAADVERAIAARPLGVYPKFVASTEWGGGE
jgi:hypothetical protein